MYVLLVEIPFDFVDYVKKNYIKYNVVLLFIHVKHIILIIFMTLITLLHVGEGIAEGRTLY